MSGGNIPNNLKPIFVAAGNQYHIPPQVLAGVADVESTLGSDRSTSSAGAVGLMQFLPSTAKGIGINPFDDRQAIFGAAKLLNSFGYQQNPLRAVGAYNGGPGNPQYGYANQVMSEANRLKGQLAGVGGGSSPMPGMGSGGSAPSFQAVTRNVFDQAGFQQAKNAYTAGTFVSQLDKSNPYEIPVKGEYKASDPLLSSGVLTTTPPDPASFMQAQTTLQRIAGGTQLSVHSAATPGGGQPGRNGLFNPLHGFSGLSFDKGIDGSAHPGTPIVAPAGSTLVDVIPDFYKGQPLLLFKFDHPIPGAPSQYWFTSEQINPVTRTIGTHFAGGQPVASFAASGTGMETGWGSPTTNDRRFAPVEAHYGQAHTGWGWHFAKFFGVA